MKRKSYTNEVEDAYKAGKLTNSEREDLMSDGHGVRRALRMKQFAFFAVLAVVIFFVALGVL